MLLKFVRITVCLAIFFLVLKTVGAKAVLEDLRRIDLLIFAGALTLVMVDALMRAVNWVQLLSRFVSARVGPTYLAYLAGGFFGTLIPSSVGNDAARAMTLSRQTGVDVRTATGTLVTLNLVGLGAVGAVGLLASIYLSIDSPSTFLNLGALLSAGLVLFASLLFFSRAGQRLLGLTNRIVKGWPTAHRLLKPLLESLLLLPEGDGKQIPLIGIAVANQLIRVAIFSLSAYSLGLSIDWQVLAFVAPMVAIVGMIPLSFLGIGINQGAMVVFLATFGVAEPDAFALSAVIASVNLFPALVGGVLMLGQSVFGSTAGASD